MNAYNALQEIPESCSRPSARVRIFNVKYSPNLGDGLLSECLEQALIDSGADEDTWSVDLAGRQCYGPGAAGRGVLIRALHLLPAPARKLAVSLPLIVQSHRRWRPHYRSSLVDADCIVIGGGNLLVDLDLNFPTKIALAVEEAARCGLPAFLYGCGVSGGWSRKGRKLMWQALELGVVRKVFVRDERSRQLWNEEFGKAFDLPAAVAPDPGLLASLRYAIPEASVGASNSYSTIGLNITSPVAVRYHSVDKPDTRYLEQWYLDVIHGLIAAGHHVAVFTNGSPEDRLCAQRLRSVLQGHGKAVPVSFPEPDTPGELVRLIGGLQGLIAFRMHAVIAAYSCRVPFLALRWDAKLDSFVSSVDLAPWLVDSQVCSATTVIDRLQQAMALGIAPDEHGRTLAAARQGVETLFAEIERTLPERRS